MADEFTLSPEMAVEPLDVSSFGGTPPLVPSQPPSPVSGAFDQRAAMKDFAPLLALLPVAAARGGQGAVAALLRGFHSARTQAFQQDRLTAQDSRAAAQQQSLEQYRRDQIEQQRLARQQQLRSQFATGLQGLENEDAINAYLQFFYPQADALGVGRADLDSLAMQTVKPSTLQKKAAEKRITALKAQFGQDKWMSEGAKFLHEVNGERVPFDELLRRAGMVPDPAAPAQAPQSSIAPDVPLDRQHAMAVASGNEALAKQIEHAISRQDAARRDPRDPVLAELARIRLDQQKTAGTQLPPNVQRRVDAKARAFDAHPIAKRASTMAEAASFASGLDQNTTNPSDDQALIYAFAKTMDPESVVREGEYATVQRHAQSWAEKFGFDVARIFSNTIFLTPQARANMKATILARFNATRQQYDNLRRSFANQINQITKSDDGESYLTDYGGAFPHNPTDATGGAKASAIDKLNKRQ